MLFYQIPGLALREFFNLLSGSAQTGSEPVDARRPAVRRRDRQHSGHLRADHHQRAFLHEHDDPAAQEPAAPHPAPAGRLGPARFARRGDQPLPRRYVRDPAVRAVAERYHGHDRLQHHRPDRDGAHQPDLHRAGAAAADRGRGHRRRLDQTHRRVPPRQQPRHRHHHRLHRRILRRGAGGQGGHGRRRA